MAKAGWNDVIALQSSEAGKRFKAGWDSFVKRQKLTDVFWDPVDTRWETYASEKFSFADFGAPKIEIGNNYFSEVEMLRDVLTLGASLRALNSRVIWYPRNGRWYVFSPKTAPLPTSPPSPGWLEVLNKQLDEISNNGRLSPAEKARARRQVLDEFFAANHG
ncbi:hypothetical protein [Rhodococcus sp. IEGM 1408]|uniref:hypothetical protein n=1 Tax=Rhodococcus sp. IEGM 1408 TaxID=3082220 RepID=UPI00295566E1|nr:hypothetical protein [Rhodococcus sp. IEGM 1408]MDV8001748.1 hypothetical protein [Rhodococcus sp. IEGM 1408]